MRKGVNPSTLVIRHLGFDSALVGHSSFPNGVAFRPCSYHFNGMTEVDWLAGKAADEMLDAVADRLTPRRWRLLGAACVRKLGNLLAPGPLRDAVEFAELADPLNPADADAWRARLAAATDAA